MKAYYFRALSVVVGLCLFFLTFASQVAAAALEVEECSNAFTEKTSASTGVREALLQYKALVYQITKLKQSHSVTDTSLAALQSEVMTRKSKLIQLGVTEQQIRISQSELEHLKNGNVSDLRQAAASVKSQNTQTQSVLAEMNPQWVPRRNITVEMFEISKFKLNGDNSTIAILGRIKGGSQLQLINAKTASVIETLVSGNEEISHLDYSSGRKYFAASFKKKIVLWDSYTGEYKTSLPHQSVVTHFAISSDGKTIFSVCGDENIYIWNVEEGTFSIFNTYPNRALTRVYLPKSSAFLYTRSLGYGFLARWDIKSKTSADGFRLGVTETEVDFTDSGRYLVTSPLYSKKLRVFDLQNEDKISVFEGLAYSPCRNIISPSGNQIVSAEETGTVRIWNLNTNDTAQTIEGFDPTGTIGFSEDGKELLLVKKEGSVPNKSSNIVIYEDEIEEFRSQLQNSP